MIELSLLIGLAAFSSYMGEILKIPGFVLALIAGAIAARATAFDLTPALLVNNVALALVMFLAGTEFEIKKLAPSSLSGNALFIGIVMLLTSFLVFYGFRSDWKESLALSLLLSSTSTLIVLTTLRNTYGFRTKLAQFTLLIALIQDAFLGMGLPWYSQGSSFNGFFILIAICFLSWRYRRFLDFLNFRTPETALLFGLTLAISVGTWLEYQGVPLSLWCFFLGVMMSSMDFRIELQSRMLILQDFLILILFVSVGFSMRASPNLSMLLVAMAAVIASRLTGSFFYPGTIREKLLFMGNITSITEVALLSIPILQHFDNWGPTISWTFLIFATASVFLSKFLPNLLPYHPPKDMQENHHSNMPPSELVFWGLGEFGREFLRVGFEHQDFSQVLALDGSPHALKYAEKLGAKIMQGDLRNISIAENITLSENGIIIVGLSDMELKGAALMNILVLLRKKFPTVDIVAIADSLATGQEYYEIGCDYVLLRPLVQARYFREIWLARKSGKLPEIKAKAMNMLLNVKANP